MVPANHISPSTSWIVMRGDSRRVGGSSSIVLLLHMRRRSSSGISPSGPISSTLVSKMVMSICTRWGKAPLPCSNLRYLFGRSMAMLFLSCSIRFARATGEIRSWERGSGEGEGSNSRGRRRRHERAVAMLRARV